MDIEEIVKVASNQDTCPYYATRTALPGAHASFLPPFLSFACVVSSFSPPVACGFALSNALA